MCVLTVLFLLFVATSVQAWAPLSSLHSPEQTIALSQGLAAYGHHTVSAYQHALTDHPLVTKMMTGGTLATVGDAIAQRTAAVANSSKNEQEEEYNVRRALSFASFDMCYRALQHVAFPIIVAHCTGSVLQDVVPGPYAAAVEQTLASQLGIVPFFYYPVFYTITAFVQDLSAPAAWERAQQTFVPLMRKNLLFWLPVQFVQFGFIDEQWQIPFLSAAGLCWTFILSLAAGSATNYKKVTDSHSTTTVLAASPQSLAATRTASATSAAVQ